jgi:hypothetical protein
MLTWPEYCYNFSRFNTNILLVIKINTALTTFALFLSCIVSAQNLTDSLVGYWKFNGDANDYSGNANNGTFLNGASFTYDRFSASQGALLLDKNYQQYVSIPNTASLQVSNELSISFWAQRNSFGSGINDQVLNKGGDWPGGSCNYGLVFYEQTLAFIYNGGYYVVGSPGVPQDYSWHYYVITTVNGTQNVNFYIDNSLKSAVVGVEANPTVDLLATADDLFIGGVNYYSNNAMDDIRIFKRVLNESEIGTLYFESGFEYTDELNLEGKAKIFPNPIDDLIKINLGKTCPDTSIELSDIHGRIIKSGKYLSCRLIEIPAGDIAPGVYLVSVTYDHTRLFHKVIKR